MKKTSFAVAAALALAAAGALTLPAAPARAADASVKCEMHYSLSGWSLIYKHATGEGTVKCDNGQSARVKINVVGGGLTAGKYQVNNGIGKITNVRDISQVFGSYAQASANAGVGKSANAQVLSKGSVSLALAGTGEGVNLGISGAKFTITKVR